MDRSEPTVAAGRPSSRILRAGSADDEWPDLVAAADFATMKARAAQLVPDAGAGMVADPDAFFARAAVGEWRESVTKECRDRFGERLAERDPDGEIARWAQHGLYSSE